MRRMSSSVAMSPAMTAAGSPGVRYRSENTTNATTAITMMVENRRRTMYAIIRPLVQKLLTCVLRQAQDERCPSARGLNHSARGERVEPRTPRSLFLLDVPHEVDRRDDHAGKIRAISGW